MQAWGFIFLPKILNIMVFYITNLDISRNILNLVQLFMIPQNAKSTGQCCFAWEQFSVMEGYYFFCKVTASGQLTRQRWVGVRLQAGSAAQSTLCLCVWPLQKYFSLEQTIEVSIFWRLYYQKDLSNAFVTPSFMIVKYKHNPLIISWADDWVTKFESER